MFTCVNNKGFQVKHRNGATVSVMFGRGSYCDNRFREDMPFSHQANPLGGVSSKDAEVAVFVGQGEMSVQGWCDAEEVTRVMAWAEKLCHCGGDFKGSDHCPECGCEEFERTCDHKVMPSFHHLLNTNK